MTIANKIINVVLVAILSTICAACSNSDSPNSNNRGNQFIIGWQTVWAPSGQVAQTLIHTDIAKKENLDLKFAGFLFGPDMNEAATNHDINCLNTGSVPTTSLLAKSKDWTIVARLIRQPLSLVAKVGSQIYKVEDLKGKTIGLPFGGGPHPYVLCLLKQHKLWDGKSELPVKLVNLLPSEQIMALQQKAVDAIATWEPQTTIAVSRNLGTVIDEDCSPGFIIVENQFIAAHPQLIVSLLKAYLWAEYYVATHREIADYWFAQESHFPKELLSKIKIVEPNITQIDPKKVDLNITDTDFKTIQEHADAMFEAGLIEQPVKFKDRTDLSYLKKAQSEWLKSANKLPAVKTIKP